MLDPAARSRFRRDPMARRALALLAALALVAVYAPLLASDLPYVVVRDGAAEFPLFARLLDRNRFESPVDIVFQPLMALLPLIALCAFALRRAGCGSGWRLPAAAALLHLLVVTLLIAHPRAMPHRDIASELARAKDSGAPLFSLHPPLRHGPFSPDLSRARPTPPEAAHPLGTDRQGRDLAARLLFALRGALLLAAASLFLFSLFGILLGALAGHFGGLADLLFLRLAEASLSLPPVLLALVVVAATGGGGLPVTVLVAAVTLWTEPARVARIEYARLARAEFVLAARAAGASEARVLLRHLLPNALPPVLVAAAFAVAQTVIVEATVAFAGFGDPLRPGLGDLLAEGVAARRSWMLVPPGLALFLLLACFDGLADAARRALDPRRTGAFPPAEGRGNA